MAKLPTPGSTEEWGTVLNEFLRVEHNDNGTLKTSASLATRVAVGALVTNVQDYGAVGDGVADDTAAIQTALAALQAANGGEILFPSGTYKISAPLIMWWNSTWRGAGIQATKLILADGANCDLVQTSGFMAHTGGTVQAGPNHFTIRDMTLDGNGGNQTATSWPLRVYGSSYHIDHVEITNGYSGGVWSEWGTGGTDMEAQWSHFKIHDTIAGPGLHWQGPHDSQFVNGEVFKNTGNIGIHTLGNAGGEQFTNVHVWGFSTVSWQIDKTVLAQNCEAEGATGVNVQINASRTIWCGSVYGTSNANSATEAGVQIGDATHQVDGYFVQVMSWQWTTATHVPFNFVNDKGGILDAICEQGSAAVLQSGSIHARSRVQIVRADPGGGGTGIMMPFSVFLPSNRAIRISDGMSDKLTLASNSSPGILHLPNATQVIGYSDNYATPTMSLLPATGAVRPGTTAGMGSSIYSGAGVPSSALGTDGDWYLRTDGAAGASLYQRRAGVYVPVDAAQTSSDPDLLAALGYMDKALETAPRHIDGNYTAVSGRVNLTYVTAYRSQTVTQLGTCCRGAAVGTLTAARWGIYTIDGSGNLTLAARTAQKTSGVYGASFAENVYALSTNGGYPASFAFVKGAHYAFGAIVTFSGTAPQIKATAVNSPTNTLARSPRLCALVGSQTDLPTAITAASLNNDGNAVYQFGLA